MATVMTFECPNEACDGAVDLWLSPFGEPQVGQQCFCNLIPDRDADGYHIVRHKPIRGHYVIAIYEADRCYGGPEEGGWWYDAGTLQRIVGTARTEEQARRKAYRINSLLAYRRELCRGPRISSVNYEGGHFVAEVYSKTAPLAYPAQRPHYE